jgi:hypothetical protein
MAEERSNTPEKQLLKLIEDPKAQDIASRGIKYKGRSFFSLLALKGRFSFFKEKINLGASLGSGAFDVKLINNGLQFCILFLALYLGGNLVFSMVNLKKIPDFSLDNKSSIKFEAPQDTSLLKKVSYYLEKARSRDIFKFGKFFEKEMEQEVVVQPPVEIREVEPSKQEQLADRLSLVGIDWSDDPIAMVEDTNAKKTHFLRRGDTVDGIKVQSILKDSVVLFFEGEEVELR